MPDFDRLTSRASWLGELQIRPVLSVQVSMLRLRGPGNLWLGR